MFEEPKDLPHPRSHDHHILLKEVPQPFRIRSYRWLFIQKTEAEKLVKEMPDTRIIQASNSRFASLVLLLKKIDGSWRFCVNYRQLNSLTTKDKFLMLLIDELLDELYGSKYFSKK